MKPREGDHVTARALGIDGGRRVRGVVLAVRAGLVLLDLPHGRWCELAGVKRLRKGDHTFRSRLHTSEPPGGMSEKIDHFPFCESEAREFWSLNEGRPLAP